MKNRRILTYTLLTFLFGLGILHISASRPITGYWNTGEYDGLLDGRHRFKEFRDGKVVHYTENEPPPWEAGSYIRVGKNQYRWDQPDIHGTTNSVNITVGWIHMLISDPKGGVACSGWRDFRISLNQQIKRELGQPQLNPLVRPQTASNSDEVLRSNSLRVERNTNWPAK